MRPESDLFVRLLLIFVVAAVVLASPAHAQVTVNGGRWQRLQPRTTAAQTPQPPLAVTDREVTLTLQASADGAPGLLIDARWRLGTGAPAWLDLRLTDPRVLITLVTINDVPAPTYPAADGPHVVAWLEPGDTIRLLGTLPTDPARAPAQIALLPAASGIQRLADPGARVPAWTGGVVVDGALWGGAPRFTVQLVEPTEAPDAAQQSITAEVGLGVTVSDDLLAVHARVRHIVRRGPLDQIVLDIPGAGADLAVIGPNVGAVDRRGDRVAVTLRQPATHLCEIELRWSSSLPDGDETNVTLPSIRPAGVTRTSRTLQLGRTGDIEVLPALSGWTATASTELAPWGRDLVAGTATASYLGGERSGGALSLLRYVPVQGPEVMIDVAEILAATSWDGRVLMRARYEVLNDRAASLSIRLPAGSRLLALRVGESAATVTWDTDGRLRVPLRRSIESLGGLLSFPVELALLFEDAAWQRRERRALQLPQVDAPIAVLRTTAHLPPGFTAWRTDGLPDRVESFSRGEGITYGIQVVTEQDRDKVARADALFGLAVQAWEGNEFHAAQGLLQELGALGAENDNVTRLQGNLSLLLSDEESSGDDGDRETTAKPTGQTAVMARRVKDQAKAKAGKDEQAWEHAQREAERSYRQGDYAEAEKQAEVALELGGKLQMLEQDESAEVRTRNERVSAVLQDARKESKKRAPSGTRSPAASPAAPPPPAEPSPAYAASVTAVPSVAATTRSVLVPELGVALRFQKLLLPAGAAPTVTLGARALRPLEES